MKNKLSIFLISMSLFGCASQVTVEGDKEYCSIESPSLTAWAYNQKGYYRLLEVCRDGNGTKCSQELLENAMKPKYDVARLESLIAEREKQKLVCGNNLPNEKRYSIDDEFYNKILSRMKSKVKNKEPSSLFSNWFN